MGDGGGRVAEGDDRAFAAGDEGAEELVGDKFRRPAGIRPGIAVKDVAAPDMDGDGLAAAKGSDLAARLGQRRGQPGRKADFAGNGTDRGIGIGGGLIHQPRHLGHGIASVALPLGQGLGKACDIQAGCCGVKVPPPRQVRHFMDDADMAGDEIGREKVAGIGQFGIGSVGFAQPQECAGRAELARQAQDVEQTDQPRADPVPPETYDLFIECH